MKSFLAILILSVGLFAQTHTFPALDTNNVFTGTNTFSGAFNLISLSNGCLFVASGLVSSQTCGGITGATANGGLVVTGTTLGMRADCTNNQVLQWNTTAWGCATIAGSVTVTGTGTTNYLPVWTSSTAIGASVLQYVGSGAFTFDYATGGLIQGFNAATGTGSANGKGIYLLAGNSGASGGMPGNAIIEIPSPAFGTTYGFILLNPTSFSANSVSITYDSTNTSTYMTLPDSGGNTSYFRAVIGSPSFACTRPTLALRTDASDASHFIYVCPGGGSTTLTAVTVP